MWTDEEVDKLVVDVHNDLCNVSSQLYEEERRIMLEIGCQPDGSPSLESQYDVLRMLHKPLIRVIMRLAHVSQSFCR